MSHKPRALCSINANESTTKQRYRVVQHQQWWRAPYTQRKSLVDGSTNVHWLSGPRALTTILKTVKCGCKTGCEAWWCGCRKKDQQCTALSSYQGGKKCSEDYNPEPQNGEYARRGPILIKDLLHQTRNCICENTPVITAGLLHVWCAVTARNYEYPFIQYCGQRKFCIF